MATHSSVLAWRIPGTGEPGGLQSMGSHRAGHDWSNLAAAGKEWNYFLEREVFFLIWYFSRLLRTKLIFFFFLHLLHDNQKISFNYVSFHVKHTKPLNSGLGPRLCTVILCSSWKTGPPDFTPEGSDLVGLWWAQVWMLLLMCVQESVNKHSFKNLSFLEKKALYFKDITYLSI